MAISRVSFDRWHGGIGPGLKEAQRGGAAYVRSLNLHEDSSFAQLLTATSKDSGSTVTDFVIGATRVPNGDIYFLGEDKKFYKKQKSDGAYSVIGTISGDTNGMSIFYWPAKDTIYITTDTTISTYGRIGGTPSLSQNVLTTFIDDQLDIPGDTEFPEEASIQGRWKMEEGTGPTSDTFNPDANPESTSVDGRAARVNQDEAFSTLRAGAGTTSDESSGTGNFGTIQASATTNQFSDIDRSIFLFDTSALPDGATITSATLQLYANSKNNGLGNLEFVVVASTPASDTAIADSDYGNLGTTALSDNVAVNDISTGAYNTWTLNASGLAAISKTGITKLGMRIENDRADSAPSWSSGLFTSVVGDYADGTNAPVLTVNYTTETRGNDSSSNGNDLTENGTITTSSDNQEGASAADLEADDNSYFSITDASQTGLDITGDLAIAGWFKLESAPTSGNRMGLVTKWTTSGDARAYEFNYFNDGGTFKLEFGLSTDGTSGNADTALVTQTLTVGTWYHLAVVYDASVPDVSFYVDSSIVSTAQSITGGSIANTGAAFQIGRLDTGSYFDGIIDDVTIWNTELSSLDVSNAKDASVGEYSVPTSITEDDDNTFGEGGESYFTPDWDPIIAFVVPVAVKGTGDWTITIHDDADTLVASKTIANASITDAADNTFTLASQWRPIVGARYHGHLTTTVDDATATAGTDVIDVIADRLVDVKSNAHPIIEVLDGITIGDDRYVRKYDGLLEEATDSDGTETSSWETVLTLPSGYEVTCAERYDEYWVYGAEYRGASTDDFANGLLVFWDGTSDTFNSFIEINEGGVQSILTTKNGLFFIAGLRGELFAFAGDSYVKVKRWPEGTYANYMRAWGAGSTIYQGVPLFGTAYETDNASLQQGVWAFGNRDDVYDPAFTHDYVVSTGSVTKSTLRIGLVKAFGTDLFIGWDDNGSYGIDIVEPDNDPASTGIFETLVFDNSPELWREKHLFGLTLHHEALPAGAEVLLSYKVDRGSWVDMSASNSTDGTTETKFSTGKVGFHEIQFKITLTATSTNFKFYGLVAEMDLHSQRSRTLVNA